MIISVKFKNGLAEVNVVSAEDSELKELPHFAQALLSTKLDSDGITKIFELLKSFTEDVLGKDDAEDNGYITDNLKEFNNEKLYDSNVNFADKVKKPENISIGTDTQAVLENKHSIVDIIISLYKKCETAKHRFKKYSQLLSILKDIRDDEYISDNDRAIIDDKIKSCEEKISGLKAAYEKLMKAISEV